MKEQAQVSGPTVIVPNGTNRSDGKVDVLGIGNVTTRTMTLHRIIGVKFKEANRVDVCVACFINVERSIHVSSV